MGILSYHFIGKLHLGQNEPGEIMDISLGSRYIQTLKKLPNTAPRIKKAVSSIKKKDKEDEQKYNANRNPYLCPFLHSYFKPLC